MKIEDLIGRRFYTLSCANDTYKIEGINNFGKVMLSLNGGDKFDYEIPQKCLNAIQSGSWILIDPIHPKPTKEEIIEKYGNVLKIKEVFRDKVRSIDILKYGVVWIDDHFSQNVNEACEAITLWHKDKGFAEIIEYKPNITQTPFYLDEYIHNNDAEKRIEAENPNTRKISELPQQFTTKDFDFNQAYLGIFREGEAWFKTVENLAGPWSVLNSDTTFAKKTIESLEKLSFQSDKEQDFDIEIQSTIQKIQELLLVKGKEYRRNNNPYHNFEVAARKKGITPERALDGFLLKHLVSYDDMLNDIEQGVLPKIEVVEEKFSDILVYFMIQKAQILNRIKNEKN